MSPSASLRSDTLEKIVDPTLRSFARGGAPVAPQSVIVELAGPVAVAARVSRALPRREEIARESPNEKKGRSLPNARGDLMDRLEHQIAQKVSDRFVRLDTAEAFVLTVTPEQLRALCGLSLVGSVRPNRVHRI